MINYENQSDDMLALAVEALQEKKGEQIVSIDLKEIPHAVADYFVICHAESKTQMETLADYAIELLLKEGQRPIGKEGFRNAEWILIDYGNLVIHVFRADKRDFYKLEELWGDAKIKTYQE